MGELFNDFMYFLVLVLFCFSFKWVVCVKCKHSICV